MKADNLLILKKWPHLISVSVILVFLTSCNETFEPLQENDKYFFTIFGYLDASADTNWVRIAPSRGQLNTPPEIPEMQVTLENIETSEAIIMNDSLFAYGDGFNFINFYTTTDIEPDHTYQLKAEYADGRTSHVTLTTPEEFPTPLFFEDQFPFTDQHTNQIIMPGVENLVDVQTWWFLRIEETNEIRKFTFSYRNSAQWIDTYYNGAYVVDFIYEHEQDEIFRALDISSFQGYGVELLHRQIYVAAAGPEWNSEIPSLTDLLYAQPEILSNVEDGLGYMVGVYSKIIPYETCHTENRGALVPCEIEKPYLYE